MAVRFINPTDGGTLSGSTHWFRWGDSDGTCLEWQLLIDNAGAEPATGDILYDSGPLDRGVVRAGPLPVDGETLTARAWCRLDSGWTSVSGTFTAVGTPQADDTVTLAPGATVALSSGMTVEELSEIGGAIALVLTTAICVRQMLKIANIR